MTERKLGLGVAGLGRAFTLMLPVLARHPRLELVAAAARGEDARRQFAADFKATTYPSVAELCADPRIDAIYIATPHELHSEQVALAAAHGKHVLVEKPMALTIADCEAMTAATRAAGVQMIVGHSHSFDQPILRLREMIASGAYGDLGMINASNYTDFLYRRPRRPEELDTELGGGIIYNQAPHQVDIVRLLGGGRVRSVRAAAGAWDPTKPTECAYTALLTFENGVFASVTYSGYAHFDTDELCGWIGESGQRKDPANYGAGRRSLQGIRPGDEERQLQSARNYGGRDYSGPTVANLASLAPRHHEHFGFIIASCGKADLRPTPEGILIYSDTERSVEPLPQPDIPRCEVIDELYDSVMLGRPPLHTGEWGLATMEVCIAILRSAREQREFVLERQVGVPGADT
jgi:phthalate 4,5-cis-dihydrodiol dehydrogenase